MQLKEVLQKTTEFFKSKAIVSSRLDAELLLSHALGLKRIDLYLKFDQPLSEAELVKCRELVKRRAGGEPVAYILGYKDFYKSRFEVSPAVLIPRPETELIVEAAIDYFKNRKEEPLSVLDLGTGSGCIGLSLLREFPLARLTAIDISQDAIAVAKRNAESLQISERVTFIHENAGTLLGGEDKAKSTLGDFDLIVANPPYIDESDPDVAPDVKRFEPHIALFAKSKGLEELQNWSRVSARLIAPKGLVLFEIGSRQKEAALKIFSHAFFGKEGHDGWSELKCEKDLSGLDRMIYAIK